MRSLLFAALLASPALADTPVVKDGFAFDELNVRDTCHKVMGALQSKLTGKDYTCAKPDAHTTHSGKPAIAICKNRKGDSAYLVFATEAECKAENQFQRAEGG